MEELCFFVEISAEQAGMRLGFASLQARDVPCPVGRPAAGLEVLSRGSSPV